jgi:hypothetical protein
MLGQARISFQWHKVDCWTKLLNHQQCGVASANIVNLWMHCKLQDLSGLGTLKLSSPYGYGRCDVKDLHITCNTHGCIGAPGVGRDRTQVSYVSVPNRRYVCLETAPPGFDGCSAHARRARSLTTMPAGLTPATRQAVCPIGLVQWVGCSDDAAVTAAAASAPPGCVAGSRCSVARLLRRSSGCCSHQRAAAASQPLQQHDRTPLSSFINPTTGASEDDAASHAAVPRDRPTPRTANVAPAQSELSSTACAVRDLVPHAPT